MRAHRLLTVAAVLAGMTILAVSEAEARRGWRRARWGAVRTTTYSRPGYARSYAAAPTSYSRSATEQAWRNSLRPSTGPITYSGISRAEQDFWRRRDAWYDHAFNGWRPEDFH